MGPTSHANLIDFLNVITLIRYSQEESLNKRLFFSIRI